MQRRAMAALPHFFNMLGVAISLVALCAMFFLTRGLSPGHALLIALPAACALGLCFLRFSKITRKKREAEVAEKNRQNKILNVLSLYTPQRMLSLVMPILSEVNALEGIRLADGIALAVREDELFAIGAMPVAPGATPQPDALIACHSSAAEHGADRLVILSNAAAGSLEPLVVRLTAPETVWMDPRVLVSLPGAWPVEEAPMKKRSLLRDILNASRIRALWRYGALMIALYIFFRQAMFLIFGSICLLLSLIARIRRERNGQRESRPFDLFQ